MHKYIYSSRHLPPVYTRVVCICVCLFFFPSSVAKRKAPQKAVHDDNVTRDIDRTQISSYNLRPRKRNYPPEDEAQAAGVSSLDRDRGRFIKGARGWRDMNKVIKPKHYPCASEHGVGCPLTALKSLTSGFPSCCRQQRHSTSVGKRGTQADPVSGAVPPGIRLRGRKCK